MLPRAGWMVMGVRGRPSALDVCTVLAVFLLLFPGGKKRLFSSSLNQLWCSVV